MLTLFRIILISGVIFLCSRSCEITFEGGDGSQIRMHKIDRVADGNKKI
jgi:hypothetical protein